MKFLIINDFNDINDAIITHFSLDKGHFIAKSLTKFKHEVYFLTNKDNYKLNDINYINIKNIIEPFLSSIDYVMIMREPLFIDIINQMPAIKDKISISCKNRIKPKFIVKSDSALWFINKQFRKDIQQTFPTIRKSEIKSWIINHVDYICAQNSEFASLAYSNGIPFKTIILSNMSIENKKVDYNKLIDPYDINHQYCVKNAFAMENGKALLPKYYVDNPDKLSEFNIKRYIVVYTGRIKTDGGKILFNMSNIMNLLGDKFELHIFPGTFIIPSENGDGVVHSARNSNSLEILRDTIFAQNKNIIVHYPYEHHDKYMYLHHANCGIDFSDTRPNKTKPLAGHAKILEYCESGLPVVCEENIHNLFLIHNGRNGIILPYLATDEQYADAVGKIVTMKIDRRYCRIITLENENWDKRTTELLEQLN